MHTPSLEGEPRPRVRREGFFVRILEALHRSRRREAIRVLRRHRHLMAGQAQVRPAKPAPESRTPKRAAGMPTEITRPRALTTGQGRTPRPGSRDVAPLSVTALAIIAALILILHVAASAVLADPLAHASPAALDDDTACLGESKPPAPTLPFD